MLTRLAGIILARLLAPVASMLLLVLLARWRGAGEIGQFNTILAWLVMFQFLTVFGLPEYLSRQVGREPELAGKYLWHGLGICLVSGAVGGLLMLGAVWLPVFAYNQDLRLALAVAAVALPFTGGLLLCQSVLTAQQKISRLALGSLAEAFLMVVPAGVMLYLGYSLVWVIGALTLSRLLCCGWYIFLVRGSGVKLRGGWDWVFLRDLFAPILIYGFTAVAYQVYMRMDVIILSSLRGMVEVGLYSSARKMTEIFLMLPVAFYLLNLPVTARVYNLGPQAARRQLESYATPLFFGVLLIAGFCLLHPGLVLGWVFGVPFASGAGPFRLMMLAFIVQSGDTVLGMACQAAGRHHFALAASWVRALVMLGLIPILVRYWGLGGAALAVLFSGITSLAILQVYVMRNLHDFSWLSVLARPVLACGAGCVAAWALVSSCSDESRLLVYLSIYLGMAAFLHWQQMYRTAVASVTGGKTEE